MRLLAAALLALTTILVGFAHRPLRSAPRGYGSAAAAHVLPGGVLPALCAWDDVGGRPLDDRRRAATGAICDACLLAGAPGLGAVTMALPPPPSTVLARVRPRQVRWRRASRRPVPMSRGPPLVG